MLTRGSENDNSYHRVTFCNVAGLDHGVVDVSEMVHDLRDLVQFQSSRLVQKCGMPYSGLDRPMGQEAAGNGEATMDAFCVCAVLQALS